MKTIPNPPHTCMNLVIQVRRCVRFEKKQKLTLPRNRLDQHFGDLVLNVCEKIIDQLSVNADAKLNTFVRRRPFGVKLE